MSDPDSTFAAAIPPVSACETEAVGGDGTLPQQIGRYRIKRLIGMGGMGCVYEAIQESPRRAVALKVMKPGIASRSALRRFEYESQLLARLRHDAIAEVYEAGVHGEGPLAVPYFAMEYIPGAARLTDYAGEKKLSTRQRLELFLEVCDAIHHGHAKGIIHRDLKPDNILVDSNGRPKVIDFGVARATDSDLAATTQQTDVGQLIGTLQYMSPEQVKADPHDLDTRSDVYSLGVVLYELLCGRHPYDLSRMNIFDASRAVRETNPARLATLDQTLRGDVETIVLKALEKDRARRYQSALELAADIRRFLHSEPIAARPASVAYQLRMFARRHRAIVAAAAAVFAALSIGLVISLWMYGRAERARKDSVIAETDATIQRDIANIARGKLEAQLTETNKARADAEREAQTAKQINEFLNDILQSASSYRMGTKVTVRDAVKAAEGRIATAFKNRPLVEAELRLSLARTYDSLGEYPDALKHARRSLELRREHLGPDNGLTYEAMATAGYLEHNAGDVAQAEVTLRQALAGLHKAYGLEHVQPIFCAYYLGIVLYRLDRVEESAALLGELLPVAKKVLGENEDNVWLIVDQLALDHARVRRHEAARPLQEQSLTHYRRRYGERNYRTLRATGNLAATLDFLSRAEESEKLHRRAAEGYLQMLGADHAETIYARVMHARALAALKRFEEAAPIARDSAQRARRQFGDKQLVSAQAEQVLGLILIAQGQHDDGIRFLQSAFDAFSAAAGTGDPSTLDCGRVLLESLALGKAKDGEAICRRLLERFVKTYGEKHALVEQSRQVLSKFE